MLGRQLRNRLVPPAPSKGNATTHTLPSLPSVSSGRQLRSRVVPIPPPDSSGCRMGICETIRQRTPKSSSEQESCVCRPMKPRAQRRNVTVETASPRSARMSLGVSLRSNAVDRRTHRRNQQSNESAAVKEQKKQEVLMSHRKQESQKSQLRLVVFNCPQKLFSSCDGDSHPCSLCLCPCPLNCVGTCQWEGSINNIIDHIGKAHCAVEKTTGPNVQIKLKNWRGPNPTQWVTFQTCLGQYFLIAVEKIEKNIPLFLGTVRVFGHQEVADRFEFRMTLKNSGRMFSYSTIVKPITDKIAIGRRDCFVFDSCLAEVFSIEDNLEIAVSVSVMKM
ncbi:E3 ubiquitin-protein ligase siah-1 [Frankliniella fusca]|uniref:E3 ubiquitin-protein ligase n=1 Tax=Frankliniella fusca TaxID=407009 RepID=A0AAE1HGB1_9NEOP|nr:E3 ubiquitin-protein ligase siah-1 [Frankliniella fusca]